MTLQEFKNWFDGFQEGIDGVPNKKQWTRVCERIAEIDGNVTTEIVFRERYWWPPLPYPWWASGTVTAGSTGSTSSSGTIQLGGQSSFPDAHFRQHTVGSLTTNGYIAPCGFNSSTAFHELGREDAKATAE